MNARDPANLNQLTGDALTREVRDLFGEDRFPERPCTCGHSRDEHDEKGRCDVCPDCPGFLPYAMAVKSAGPRPCQCPKCGHQHSTITKAASAGPVCLCACGLIHRPRTR